MSTQQQNRSLHCASLRSAPVGMTNLYALLLRNDSRRKRSTMSRDGAGRGEPDLLAARRDVTQRALEML